MFQSKSRRRINTPLRTLWNRFAAFFAPCAKIRRANGAKRRNIMTQFILEAIVLCEVGGAIGVALGIIGGNVAAYFLKVPPSIPLDWVGFGLFICSLVGIIFGTYPAYKAASLDPIESL